jgi:hypothetical protein
MAPKAELFTRQPDAELVASQAEFTTGLDALAEYTLVSMPAELRDTLENPDKETAYANLADSHRGVLSRSEMEILSLGDTEVHAAEVAQLDLLFMLGSYLPGGADADKHVPGELRALIAYNKERFGLPDHMDFHMIVDVNTREYTKTGNIRTYTDGEIGDSERDFYIGHHFAEPHVKLAAFQLKTLLQTPDMANKEALLASSRDHIAQYDDYIRDYGKLSRDHFGYFRQYLVAYPDGTRNASGAFLPSVQMLEAVVHPPTEKYQEFLDTAMPHFPAWARPIIDTQRHESLKGNNIYEALQDGRLELTARETDLLGEVIVAFYNSKHTHAGIAHRQIPQAFRDGKRLSWDGLKDTDEQNIFELGAEIAGTGDFDVSNVLGNGILRLMQRMDAMGVEL